MHNYKFSVENECTFSEYTVNAHIKFCLCGNNVMATQIKTEPIAYIVVNRTFSEWQLTSGTDAKLSPMQTKKTRVIITGQVIKNFRGTMLCRNNDTKEYLSLIIHLLPTATQKDKSNWLTFILRKPN